MQKRKLNKDKLHSVKSPTSYLIAGKLVKAAKQRLMKGFIAWNLETALTFPKSMVS